MSRVPHVPGDQDHPEWWTEEDQKILTGELDKLRAAGPKHLSAGPKHLAEEPILATFSPGWQWVLGSLLLLSLAFSIAVVMLGVQAGQHPTRFVETPTTYGAPGPSGGPVLK